jgi:hypothetical protein
MDKLPIFTPGTSHGSAMDNTWAIIVSGDGSVQERKLGHHSPGTELTPSVTVVSNTVTDGVRVVVVSRALLGATADHYTFKSVDTPSIGMINAVGSSPTFGYHKKTASTKLYYCDVDAPTCLCDDAPPLGSTSSQGTIGTVSFTRDCGPRPLGQMLDDVHWANTTVDPKYGNYTNNRGVNPTCELAAYRGGIKCCAGGTLITDGADNRAALIAEADYDNYQVTAYAQRLFNGVQRLYTNCDRCNHCLSTLSLVLSITHNPKKTNALFAPVLHLLW